MRRTTRTDCPSIAAAAVPRMGETRGVILSLESVTFRRGGNEILRGLDWQVREDEHWAVVGPNGAGKTTLLRIAAARAHPTTGTIDVLGGRLGRVPVRRPPPRVAPAGPEPARPLPPPAPPPRGR